MWCVMSILMFEEFDEDIRPTISKWLRPVNEVQDKVVDVVERDLSNHFTTLFPKSLPIIQ